MSEPQWGDIEEDPCFWAAMDAADAAAALYPRGGPVHRKSAEEGAGGYDFLAFKSQLSGRRPVRLALAVTDLLAWSW